MNKLTGEKSYKRRGLQTQEKIELEPRSKPKPEEEAPKVEGLRGSKQRQDRN